MTRIVAPEYPHHITQRGNRGQQTFFNESDYSAYIDLLICVLLKFTQRASKGMNAAADLLAMIFLLMASNWKSGNH